MLDALRRLWRRWFGPTRAIPEVQDAIANTPTASSTPSALDLMKQMRADRGGQAAPDAWAGAMSNFRTRVFSRTDRARLWRRERRKHPGDLEELELIVTPSAHDLAALNALLDQLSR